MTNTSSNRILVVKVGTSTLTDGAGRLDRSFILDLTSQLASMQQDGWDVILVSSGAIRAGAEALDARATELRQPAAAASRQNRAALAALRSATLGSLPYKQAAAAIGQSRLMHTYTEAFAWRSCDCAQVLLTGDDIADKQRLSNARNTLLTLLSLGVVPIINENDTVAIDEIKLGDNDNLAALVARLIGADLLVILSDVEGLYQDHPSPKSGECLDLTAAPIPVIERVDETVLALAGRSAGTLGTGGMRTKVEAARLATEAGIRTVIARGRRSDVIRQVAEGAQIGTVFLPQGVGF